MCVQFGSIRCAPRHGKSVLDAHRIVVVESASSVTLWRRAWHIERRVTVVWLWDRMVDYISSERLCHNCIMRSLLRCATYDMYSRSPVSYVCCICVTLC
jgi:hypothetical protein